MQGVVCTRGPSAYFDIRHGEASDLKSQKHSWIGSVQGAIATWSNHGGQDVREYHMLIRDQVATAPCTDPIQVRLRVLRQSQLGVYEDHYGCQGCVF